MDWTCTICKQNAELNEVGLCTGCINFFGELLEISDIAEDIWKHSKWYSDDYREEALETIKQMIDEIEEEEKESEFLLRAEKLEEKIVSYIQRNLQEYRHKELVIGGMTVKEYCRRFLLEEGMDYWGVLNDYNVGFMIQEFVASLKQQDLEGNRTLEEKNAYGRHGFLQAIIMGRRLLLLRDNVARYKYVSFTDNLFDLVKSLYEDEELESYMERFLVDGRDENPEDLEINDPQLLEEISRRGLRQDQIRDFVNDEVEKLFGFSFAEMNKLFVSILSQDPTNRIFGILPKKPFFKLAKDLFEFNQKKVQNMIDALSINRLFMSESPYTTDHFELRSIYETDDFLVYGKMDLAQNIGIFEKLVLSSHFIDMYFTGEFNSTPFQNSQEKYAELFAIKLAESLNEAGYQLPREIKNGQSVIRAEIDGIEVNGRNILRVVGDIDVLALNPRTKELLLIELKYYKPAMTIRDMVLSDKRRVDKTVQKMKNREAVIESQMRDVIRFIGADTLDNYHIKSILVTIRPNFYCFRADLGITYYTWKQLHDLLRNGQDI